MKISNKFDWTVLDHLGFGIQHSQLVNLHLCQGDTFLLGKRDKWYHRTKSASHCLSKVVLNVAQKDFSDFAFQANPVSILKRFVLFDKNVFNSVVKFISGQDLDYFGAINRIRLISCTESLVNPFALVKNCKKPILHFSVETTEFVKVDDTKLVALVIHDKVIQLRASLGSLVSSRPSE